MRSYDLAPLYRSTVGFDRIFSLMDQIGTYEGASNGYPPYNIEKISDDGYRITLAVAGFAQDELAIETQENSLVIRGEKSARTEGTGTEEAQFLFQGIAARQFERRFQLADYVSVTNASLENGLLHVDLVREIPEAKKTRLVPIAQAGAAKAVKARGSQALAA